MKFDIEIYTPMEEVRRCIQDCEGRHMQQVAYSTFHDALTQICFGCQIIRSSIKVRDELHDPWLREE